MAYQTTSHACRRDVIEKDEHAERVLTDGDGSGCVKASRRKFEDSVNLLARDIKLLNDFLNARAGFEVFEDGRYRQPCTTKYPRAVQSPRHAFHDRAFRPIEVWHDLRSFPQGYRECCI